MYSHHQNLAGNSGGAGRLQAKINMPKAFAGAKLDGTEVDMWICLMNLYFTALYIPEDQRAMHVTLNLSEEVAVWLCL